MMRSFTRKVQHSLKRRGVTGTLCHGPRAVWSWVAEQTPARRLANERRQAANTEFDRAFGVDTGGVIGLEQFAIADPSVAFGNRYQPIYHIDFESIMRPLGLDYSKYIFIDLGSGKGRALLLASHLPFQRIIGVEFSQELHEIAERNVASYRSDRQQCRQFELERGDAMTYAFPDEPTVLYLYHPFGEEVMRPVLENLARSLQRLPRDLVVLYFNPVLAAQWESSGLVNTIVRDESYHVYRVKTK
jgi:SAM-dependent methyltransferase